MSNCPKCNHEFKEDFGLVSCAGCGLSVLIGIDGQVESQEEPPGLNVSLDTEAEHFEVTNFSSEQPLSVATSHEVLLSNEKQSIEDEFSVVQSEYTSSHAQTTDESQAQSGDLVDEFTSFETDSDPAQDFFNQSDEEAINDELSQLQSTYSQEGESSLPEESAVSDVHIEAMTGTFGEEEALQPPELNGDAAVEDKAQGLEYEASFKDVQPGELAKEALMQKNKVPKQTGLADLSEFANSNKSSVKDGVLKYNLFLAGIDSHDIKKQLFDELSVKRLALDVEQLGKSIKNGELLIHSISAVKASIIINRLCHLPISIQWDQYDIRKA